MKKIIFRCIIVVIFIASIITTFKLGMKVSPYYGEGETIIFQCTKDINVKEIEDISKQVFENQVILVQRVEFFNNSIQIKVQKIEDGDIKDLCAKVNEKYGTELEESDFNTRHSSNIQLRSIIRPYIMPVIISAIIILFYYAIRYKGTSEMIRLVINGIIGEGLLYSLYALGRIPITVITLPIALILYVFIVIITTIYNEKNQKNEN